MDSSPWDDYAAPQAASNDAPWADYGPPPPTKRYGTGKSFDAIPGGIAPTGSPAAHAAQAPIGSTTYTTATGQNWTAPAWLSNGLAGVGKLYTDMGLGAQQRFAQLTGSPNLPALQQQAVDKRTLDAPLQATTAAKAGEIVGGLPAAFIPGANTYGGAATLGGLFGAAEPTIPGESTLVNTGVGAGLGIAGKWGGDRLGSWLNERAKAPFMGWSPANATKIAAQAVGSDRQKLDQPAIAEATDRIGGIFNQVRSPDVSVTPAEPTLNAVISAGSNLNRSTRSAFENNENVTDLLNYALNGKPANGYQLGQLSSKLGQDARAQMTSKDGDRALGRALFDMQNHVDDLVGSTIQDPDLASAYTTARQQYRSLQQLTTNPTILNSSTGEVNMTALGKYLQRTDKPGYLRGGNQSDLYNAARWGQATGQGSGPPPWKLGSDLGVPNLMYYGVNNPASRALGGLLSRGLRPTAPIATPLTQGLLTSSEQPALPYINAAYR